MSWIRQLPLLLILLLTLGIIVAPSFLIPWFVRDITIDNPPIPSAEAKYRVNLERAHNFEELGELDAALAEFQAALESTNDDVKNAAVEGIRRVDGKMNHPFSLWEDLNLIREFSLRARLPIILALLAFLLIQAFNVTTKPRG